MGSTRSFQASRALTPLAPATCCANSWTKVTMRRTLSASTISRSFVTGKCWILAEALFERDGTISDGDLNRTIKLLRDRVGMPALTNGLVSANGPDMLTEIRRERTVELAFEGFRRDDLRRWKTAETELPQALRGVKFVGTEYQQRDPGLVIGADIQVDAGGFVISDPAASRQFIAPKHYLDPLPLQQIQLSKGTLTQNPGW